MGKDTLVLSLTLILITASVCVFGLTCKHGHSGPTYESLQEVFDRKPFRPAVNLSNPTIANISFTLYAVLGVVIRDVRVKPALPFEQMSGNSKRYLEASGEWDLVVILGEADILKFGIDEWDIITFWVVIKRRPILYVVNLLIPSSFLMVIDILSFYLPPHSVDRASFKMTLILGYTVFLLIMNDLLPSTANGTPIIGIYFSVCLAMMVISLLETVIITNVLHHNSMKYRPVPQWVRLVVLKYIARLICYSDPDISNTQRKILEQGDIWSTQQAQISTSQHSHANAPGAVPELVEISECVRAIRNHLTMLQREEALQDEWCHVGYVLDFLLFRVYLMLITCYAFVIIFMWCCPELVEMSGVQRKEALQDEWCHVGYVLDFLLFRNASLAPPSSSSSSYVVYLAVSVTHTRAHVL
ncbi:5-hydroxytryptamine receptor 3A [Bagarius yarrelli]|uniref:5-hydroxytryptamine receptor 3A n=1 Tax=Bagarius yarrelli TaxID=175774 RepID=A0A556TSG5_BAGYA|nr:5-hydroxytryptamine receptor 3A [Bagarius yarrelli]